MLVCVKVRHWAFCVQDPVSCRSVSETHRRHCKLFLRLAQLIPTPHSQSYHRMKSDLRPIW